MVIKIPMAEATLDQLRLFASAYRGITIDNRWNPVTLKAKIAETGWAHDYVEIDEASETVKAKVISAAAAAGDTDEDNRLVRITINKEANVPGGKDPVWVSVNTVGIWIPRGEMVKVKAKYARALRDAVYRDYPETDTVQADQGALLEPVDVPRFPITFHDPIDPAPVERAA